MLSSEESQVVIHCSYAGGMFGGHKIRIWKSISLIPRNSTEKCKLVHAERVSIAPAWTEVPPLKLFSFTLIFTGLPKDCVLFDLIEDIPKPNGIIVKGIRRNRSDVYTVDIL